MIELELPEFWQSANLGDIARLVGGGTPSRQKPEYFTGTMPWLTGYDLPEDEIVAIEQGREYITQQAIDESATNPVPAQTVLLTTRVTVGKVGVTAVPLCFSQDLTGIVLNDTELADPYYIAYCLLFNRERLLRLNQGSTINGVTRTDVARLSIPLPPPSEQHRIVAILRQADELRRLRRQANERAQGLLPALFEEMFGDPVTNPKGWDVKPLSQLGELDRGRSRHRPRDAAHLYGGPYSFVQTGDVANSGGWITNYSQTYSEAGLAQSRLWPKRTLCITIAANIAKTGILTFDACFPDSVVGFIPGPQATAEYVMFLLNAIQPRLESFAPQAAQKNINLQTLRELRVPHPSNQLQLEFVVCVEEVRATKELTKISTERGDSLFQSLLFQAFSGELTAGWREARANALAREAEEIRKKLEEQKGQRQIRIEFTDAESFAKVAAQLDQITETFSRTILPVSDLLANIAPPIDIAKFASPAPDLSKFFDTSRLLQQFANAYSEPLNAALKKQTEILSASLTQNAAVQMAEVLRQISQPFQAELMNKIAQLIQLQHDQPPTRAEVQETVLEVLDELPRYWTLKNLADDWRFNHLPRTTLREAVEMLVVLGQLRPAVIRRETSDPQNPSERVEAYTRITERDLVTAADLQL